MFTRVQGVVRVLMCVVVAALVISVGTVEAEYVPALIQVVLDASGSVSVNDFQKANQVVADFTDVLVARSIGHQGELSDWIAVSYFGGEDEYSGTDFIKCADSYDMGSLYTHLRTMSHPQFGQTAIYNAAALGTIEMLTMAETLQALTSGRSAFFKILVVVTDGQDTASSAELKSAVRQAYPNGEILLCVVGVGNGAKIAEFQGIADMALQIENFDELLATLFLVLELVSAV